MGKDAAFRRVAEALRAGHPNRLCDGIAEEIVRAHLAQDPYASLAIAVSASSGRVLVTGEAASRARVDYEAAVWKPLEDAGCLQSDLCPPGEELRIDVRVRPALRREARFARQTFVGEADGETEELLPLPRVLAARLCDALDELQYVCPWLGADGLARVAMNGVPGASGQVTGVLLRFQREADAPADADRAVLEQAVRPAIPERLRTREIRILLNPPQLPLPGSLAARSGHSGRSGAVGLTPDRPGSYGPKTARALAEHLVAQGLAARCRVWLTFRDDASADVRVYSFGTGRMDDARLARLLEQSFDLRPASLHTGLHAQTRYSAVAVTRALANRRAACVCLR